MPNSFQADDFDWEDGVTPITDDRLNERDDALEDLDDRQDATETEVDALQAADIALDGRLDTLEAGGGGTPADGSVTNAKVASGAAISADKLADGTSNKVMTAAERTKLTGIATGATANSTDATLLARANHTGTQAATTISGLASIATSGSATDLGSGTVPTARLGSGTASSTTFLRGDQTWATPAGGSSTTVTANTQTGTTYTLVLGDAGLVVERNNASANTTTVPPNSSVAFPTGTVLEVAQYGAGQSTVVAGGGVTIRTPSTLILRAQYSTVALRKRGTDEWVLSGDVQ